MIKIAASLFGLLVFISTAQALPLRNDSQLVAAENMIRVNKDQAALMLLDEMLGRDVRNIDAYVLRAHLNAKAEEYNEARKNLRKAIALNPKHLGAQLTIGRIYITLDELSKAREHLSAIRMICGGEDCPEYQSLLSEIDTGDDVFNPKQN